MGKSSKGSEGQGYEGRSITDPCDLYFLSRFYNSIFKGHYKQSQRWDTRYYETKLHTTYSINCLMKLC